MGSSKDSHKHPNDVFSHKNTVEVGGYNMASAVKESVNEKIEIVDLPEEEQKKGGVAPWIAAILGLALVAGVFWVLRRFLAPADEG